MTQKEMDIALKKSQKEFEKRLKKIGKANDKNFTFNFLKVKI
jgi:hypothetical protein